MMSRTAGQRRVTVIYRGRVQGVGFRYTTTRLAAGFPVEGYVMNLSDGSVRLEAEGDPIELKRFLEAIDTSDLGAGLRGSNTRWSEGEGRFQGFRIRYQTLE